MSGVKVYPARKPMDALGDGVFGAAILIDRGDHVALIPRIGIPQWAEAEVMAAAELVQECGWRVLDPDAWTEVSGVGMVTTARVEIPAEGVR